jgi:hypothetical protein
MTHSTAAFGGLDRADGLMTPMVSGEVSGLIQVPLTDQEHNILRFAN